MQLDLPKVVASLRKYMEEQLAPFVARLAALENRQPEKGQDGKDVDMEVVKELIQQEVARIPAPQNGKDADAAEIKQLVVDAVSTAVSAIPVPKDGNDGKDVDLDEIKTLIQHEVANIPVPKDGKDADAEQVKALISKAIADAVAALPPPKPGEPGKDAKSFTADEVKAMLKDIHEAEAAKWALDFERRASDLIQRTIDRIEKPKDGLNGLDGLGFDDLKLEDDGAGNLKFIFARGEQKKEFAVKVPVFVDRGVFKEGTSDYLQGNGVTFGGNFYLAQKDNPEGKPGLSADWRLACKKGRDGKDFSK